MDEKGSCRDDDSDAVWMVSIGDGNNDVTQRLSDCGGGDDVAKYELWMEDEIAADEADSVKANKSVDSFSVDEPLVEDLGDEPMSTFMAVTLANPSIFSSSETKLYDSGASQHMSSYKHKFINYVPIQTKVLTVANRGTFNATGKGDMHISMPNRQYTTRILLKDVLYAPKIGVTLISISKIDAAGFTSLFYQGFLKIFSFDNGKKCLAEVAVQNGLYCVEHEAMDVVAAVDAEVVTIEKLHHLMGHISPDTVKVLVKKGIVDGFTLNESSEIKSCDSCKYGKAHRKLIGKVRVEPWASNIGDEVHSDVWGPSPIQTIGSCEYYTTYMDDNSAFSHIYLLHHKSETFDAYKMYEAELRKQKGIGVKRLHSDRGGEYVSEQRVQ